MKYTLQQNSWHGGQPTEISLPEDWDIELHEMPGDKLPVLSREEIRAALLSPFGSPGLDVLAKGKQNAVIVFDDITRGTPVQVIAEVVLEELHKAGLKRNQIRFLCAVGLHGAHTAADFTRKLGKDIVAHYDVFNHNPYENCTEIGVTKRGVKVCINKEFMMCDLRIGIGAITPHHFNGYGGGGKMLFPGLAYIDTIEQNHSTAVRFLRDNKLNLVVGMGHLENSGMRTEVEEMTRMVGQFFKIDCLYSTHLEPVAIFAGDPVEEFYEGVKIAQDIYATPPARDKDVVIVNANAKANEAAIAVNMALLGLRESGGDIVLVNFSQMGQMTHYLFGAFGTSIGGRMCNMDKKVLPCVRQFIYYSPYHIYSDLRWFGDPDKITCVTTWDEVLSLLSSHGSGTKASIIADGTLEYYRA